MYYLNNSGERVYTFKVLKQLFACVGSRLTCGQNQGTCKMRESRYMMRRPRVKCGCADIRHFGEWGC